MIDTLKEWAADRGYRVGWGPAEVVRRARAAIRDRRDLDELDEEFCRDQLEFLFDVDESGGGETVVVVAIPRPAHRVGFEVGDGRFDALLPPTYLRYRATFEEVRQDLAANGLPGAQVEHLTAPLKTVATMLGLVRYGRNNIAYAEGIGSYMQLCAYTTDAELPISEDRPVIEPELLAECEECTICQSACPTKAISDDRVLLHAERCITLANEYPGEWPDAISSRAHHSLIGCLLCQRACPANPKLEIDDAGVCFSADETRSLMDGDDPADSHAENGIRAKLAVLGQPQFEPVLGRNLRALLERRSSVPRSALMHCD
jgi:epoxyqueuosine reductase